MMTTKTPPEFSSLNPADMAEADTIRVFVNGERRDIQAGQSVLAFLKSLQIAPDRVAVELNKSLVRKRDWPGEVIPDGARIEIVEFVGGG